MTAYARFYPIFSTKLALPIFSAAQRSWSPWYFSFPFARWRHFSHGAQSSTVLSKTTARPS